MSKGLDVLRAERDERLHKMDHCAKCGAKADQLFPAHEGGKTIWVCGDHVPDLRPEMQKP